MRSDAGACERRLEQRLAVVVPVMQSSRLSGLQEPRRSTGPMNDAAERRGLAS